MKIRTITTGFNLNVPLDEAQMKRIGDFTNGAKSEYEKLGYTVQTIRISTQPWEEYLQSKSQIIKLVKCLDKSTQENNLNFFNIGTTFNAKNIPLIYDILKNTSNCFCTTMISDDRQINYEAARQTAKLMKKLSIMTRDGFTNLRFAALFNTKPGSPFYPAAYHEGPTSFAIGTENSDLVNKAFSNTKNLEEASVSLKTVLNTEYNKLERIAQKISRKGKIKYDGLDVSIATSVKPNESIAFAFEKLGLGKFGEPGTLTVAKIITETLRQVNVKKCGYSGLMLPVLEDYGLAQRNKQGVYNITNLLLYSSVCGTGLDTIPLPGNISEKKLYALLLDIASLSIKLNKPLSARLIPVPGMKIGQMTKYDFEYFVNSKIMKL